jgi:hypothetical protein
MPKNSSRLGCALRQRTANPLLSCPLSSLRLMSRGQVLGLSLVLRKRHPFADDFAARLVFRLHAQSFALNGGRRQHKGRVRCFRSVSTALDDLARASFPAHMGRASSWPNALADRGLLSWLCLQTRFRQILESARIVDRLVAKLLQRFSGERRAPA